MQPSTSRLAGVVTRTRPLPARKQLLFSSTSLLLTSNDLVLFLRPSSFTAQEWRSIRSSLTTTTTSSSSSSPSDTSMKLTLLRPGLLPALLRDSPSNLDLSYLSQSTHLSGPLAVVTSPKLSPPLLSKVLKLLEKFSKSPQPNTPPPPKGSKPVERLELLSSLLEKRVAASRERTKEVGKLPELEQLRSMIVGVLSAPGSRITGVIGAQARQVGRTVEGFKVGLEDGQNKVETEGEAEP